jgi:hypothetical protein
MRTITPMNEAAVSPNAQVVAELKKLNAKMDRLLEAIASKA